MSLSSTVARNNYLGNGAVSVYAYSFRIFDDDDLTVVVRNTDGDETLLVKTTDYTVSAVGVSSGGNVTLVNASQAWLTAGKLTSNYELAIIRQPDIIQASDFRNQGTFFAETHEDAFDYCVMIDQRQQDEIDRCLHLPDSIDPADFDTELPSDIADNPGATIIVNSAGDGFSLGTPAVSFFIRSTTPPSPSADDLVFWFDLSVGQMKVWCVSEWRVFA